MNNEHKIVLNELNGKRAKIYYQLNQLEELTGLSSRALKYKMKVVKEKYANMPNLLHRTGKSWQIHFTLIGEFFSKYKKEKTVISNHPWETIITWNLVDNYDVDYHIQLINEVKEQLPSVNIGYVVEVDGRGINHLHAITDGYKDNIKDVVVGVLNKYIASNLYRPEVEKINNIGSVTSYLRKYGEITII